MSRPSTEYISFESKRFRFAPPWRGLRAKFARRYSATARKIALKTIIMDNRLDRYLVVLILINLLHFYSLALFLQHRRTLRSRYGYIIHHPLPCFLFSVYFIFHSSVFLFPFICYTALWLWSRFDGVCHKMRQVEAEEYLKQSCLGARGCCLRMTVWSSWFLTGFVLYGVCVC